jgi:hypothetical protein
VELAELADEPWLLPRDSIFQMFVAEGFRSKGLTLPKLGVRSYSVHQRFNLLATNGFIGVEAASLLRFNVDRFPFKVLQVDFAARSFSAGVITLKSRKSTPIAQALIDCLREVAKPTGLT